MLEQGDQESLAILKGQIAAIDRQFREVVEMLPIGFIVHHPQSILYQNSGASAILGRESMTGLHILDFFAGEHRIGVKEVLDAAFEARHTGRFTAELKDFPMTFVEVIVAPLNWGGTRSVQVLLQDVTERRLRTQQLEYQATHDAMTGLLNRARFFELGDREIRRARRYRRPLSVIIFDIDHFKQVNDTYGHAVGDDVIKVIAKEATHAMRLTDIIGRIGGEEFAVVLPETELDGAEILAERLRERISEKEQDTPKGPLHYTISAGVALLSNQHTELAELLKVADQALYTAKNSGRNRVIIARDTPQGEDGDGDGKRETRKRRRK